MRGFWYLSVAAVAGTIVGVCLMSRPAEATMGTAATASANATATVLSQITLTKNQDLAFGVAAPSDPAKTVNPSTDTTNSAKFTVGGNTGYAYNITIPSAPIDMITGAGSTADTKIQVSTFTSDISTGTIGTTSSFYVGAQRAAIRSTQTAGSYSGSFTVSVIYQ